MAKFRARYTALEKKAFGQLLRRLMTEQSLSGADLARQATLHLPKGKVIGRDNISWYRSGRSIPVQASLVAIAKVLNVDPVFLVPRSHDQRPGDLPAPANSPEHDVRMAMTASGDMHLMLNVHLPRELGWKILQMIEDNKKAQSALPKSR